MHVGLFLSVWEWGYSAVPISCGPVKLYGMMNWLTFKGIPCQINPPDVFEFLITFQITCFMYPYPCLMQSVKYCPILIYMFWKKKQHICFCTVSRLSRLLYNTWRPFATCPVDKFAGMWHYRSKVWNMIFIFYFFMLLKVVSYVYQGCIYLINKWLKCKIVKFYFNWFIFIL